jgi:hypothetical protein
LYQGLLWAQQVSVELSLVHDLLLPHYDLLLLLGLLC